MYEIRITNIGPIVTEPHADAEPAIVSIEILTAGGPKALELPASLAMQLAVAIVRHLRDEQSLANPDPVASPAAGGEKP
ncbi:MAG: hypothetical protein ABSG83_08220 [Roseiarcus sp.]|jgi:hypothetical protein